MANTYINIPANSGGSSGVTSLNSLTGALTLVAGSGITVTPAGSNITIASTVTAGANTALSNLSAVAINVSLLTSNATQDLGDDSGHEFANLYMNDSIYNPADGSKVLDVGNRVLHSDSNATQLDFKTSLKLGAAGLTFPAVDGTANQVLKTNGAGVLSWTTVAAGSNDYFHMQEGAGYGSSSTTVKKFTNIITNTGSSWTVINDATLGATVTIITAGVYSFSFCDGATPGSVIGMTVNSAALTTVLTGQTPALVLGLTGTEAGSHSSCSWTGPLSPGDVVRPQTQGDPDGPVAARTHFYGARIV